MRIKNKNKLHLTRLPDMLPEQPPKYPGKSKKCIVLIPVYSSNTNIDDLVYVFARAAVWNRRAWLNLTDAIDLDIKVAFYVNTEAFDILAPVFNQFGINTASDIFLFDYENGSGKWSKKTAVFNDKQFSQYDWLILIDSDNFIACKNKMKAPFFRYVIDRPIEKCIGVIRPSFYKNRAFQVALDSRSEKKIKCLVPPEVYKNMIDHKKDSINIHGGIYMFPSKFMHKKHPEDCHWIVKAGKLLNADEVVFETWWYLQEKNKIFDISNEFDIDLAINREPPDAIREKPYLFHLASTKVEWIFRHDTDSLER